MKRRTDKEKIRLVRRTCQLFCAFCNGKKEPKCHYFVYCFVSSGMKLYKDDNIPLPMLWYSVFIFKHHNVVWLFRCFFYDYSFSYWILWSFSIITAIKHLLHYNRRITTNIFRNSSLVPFYSLWSVLYSQHISVSFIFCVVRLAQ